MQTNRKMVTATNPDIYIATDIIQNFYTETHRVLFGGQV